MRAQRCSRARGALGRLRRRRPGGRGAAGGAARHLPGDGHAARRAELPRRAQHGARGADGRHVRAGRPPAGRIAFASQSGAYGIAALDHAERRGLGLSSFVSMGNKADLSGNDFLRFWEQDGGTDAVLLYLESLGNPQRFGQICRRLTASKPVIVVKSGRSAAGRRAASSHTGALLQASEATVDALFDHAGVIRVQTLDEQLDVAELLAHQPLPRGDRVAIVTNAGGPAVSCVDAGVAAGLRVEPLTEDTRRALADHLPPAAALTNPVDMLAAATSADFRRTIETVAADPDVDAIIAIFLQALPGRGADMVLRAIRAAARRTDVPVLAALMTAQPASAAGGVEHDVPVYATPEQPPARSRMPRATRGTGAAARRTRSTAGYRLRRGGRAHRGGAGGRRRLARLRGDDEAAPGLRRAGGGAHVAGSPNAAGRWAATAGDDVALKAIVPALAQERRRRRSLGLRGASAVARAARELRSSLEAAGNDRGGLRRSGDGAGGRGDVVGVVCDPQFGPVAARRRRDHGRAARRRPGAPGAGGALEATEMIRALRTFPLLDGYRDAPVPTSPPWRTSSCASAGWPPTIPRSPSSTSIR